MRADPIIEPGVKFDKLNKFGGLLQIQRIQDIQRIERAETSPIRKAFRNFIEVKRNI